MARLRRWKLEAGSCKLLSMLMNPFRKAGDPHLLVVGMTGVKMGDRIAQIGCAHGGRLAAVARGVGLSGHAIAVVPDERAATRVRKGAAEAGVLVELEVAPLPRVPLDDNAFDLVVIDETAGLLGALNDDQRAATIREARRVLKPGGRLMVIGNAQPGSLAGLFRKRSTPTFDVSSALQTDGFKSVRTLAEREGLVFFEGIKSRGA